MTCSHFAVSSRRIIALDGVPPSLLHQHRIGMAYSTGEFPETGDCVRNKEGRRGVVTHILRWDSGYSELIIGWDDGTTGIRYTVQEDFELLRRRGEREIALSRR